MYTKGKKKEFSSLEENVCFTLVKALDLKNIYIKKLLLSILIKPNYIKPSFPQAFYSCVLTSLGKSKDHFSQNFSREQCKSRECENI